MAEQTALELVPRTVPTEPICRDAVDATTPCRYAVLCDETRQRLMHYNSPRSLRGERCWKFNQLAAREARHLPVLP